jgi:hypothetical protein
MEENNLCFVLNWVMLLRQNDRCDTRLILEATIMSLMWMKIKSSAVHELQLR